MLDGMQQAQYVVRRLQKHGMDNYSHTGRDATSTMRRETAVKAWIQRSLTP